MPIISKPKIPKSHYYECPKHRRPKITNDQNYEASKFRSPKLRKHFCGRKGFVRICYITRNNVLGLQRVTWVPGPGPTVTRIQNWDPVPVAYNINIGKFLERVK